MSFQRLQNGGQSALTSSVNNTSNPVTLQVVDGTKFPNGGNFTVIVDTEIMTVTAVSGNNLTATRAGESTTIATHSSGANVTCILTVGCLSQYISDRCTSDVIANLPVAGVQGRLFYPTDVPACHFRDNGTSWDCYAAGQGPFTPPISGFPTNINPGSRATFDTSKGFLRILDAGPTTGSDVILGQVKTAPSTPWTADLVFSVLGGGNCQLLTGLLLGDSSTGKLKAFMASLGPSFGSRWNIANLTNSTTWNNNAGGQPMIWTNSLIYQRITNDGTTLKFGFSGNGVDYIFDYSEAVSGNFVATIDQVGYFLDNFSSNTTTQLATMNVFHAVVG